MKFISIFLIYLFCIVECSAQISNNETKKYLLNLDSFYSLNPLEKTYMQTNKNWYNSNEFVYFKLYITVANQLTELSKVVYVDLINNKDSVCQKSMWKVEKGSVVGSIHIPSQLQSGIYKLRAYTLWMLNNPNTIDEKLISIILPNVENYNSSTKNSDVLGTFNNTNQSINIKSNYIINFFPEGGDLVDGIESSIAYKVTTKSGKIVKDFDLILEDNVGNTIVKTKPLHDGMGKFDFLPSIDKTYKASIKINGVNYIPNFPSVHKTGVGLQVNTLNTNKIFVSVKKITTTDTALNNLVVIAHVDGYPYFVQNIDMSAGIAGFAISKRQLPHGVLNITVFDANMKPLAERLIFVKKIEAIQPELSIEKKSFDVKSKNIIRIVFPTDSCNVSVAITSGNDGLHATNNNVASYFLLTGEIKGKVNQPNFYFESNDSLHNKALDLLMLTQGWRRFDVNAIAKAKMPPLNYFIETGISIRGLAKNEVSKIRTINEAKVDFLIKGEDSTTILATTQIIDNKFFINNLDFRKKAKIFYQTNKFNTRDDSFVADLEPNYIDTLNKTVNINKTDLYDAIEDSLNKVISQFTNNEWTDSGQTTLKNVTVTTKIKTIEQKLTDEYVSDWYKSSDFTYAIDSSIGYVSVWQFLQANVPSLNVSGDLFDPTVNFSRVDGITNLGATDQTFIESMNNGKSSIAFFLNEMAVPIATITDISPRDIALIKVNRNGNAVTNAPAGSMFIYTRKNLNVKNSFTKQIITGYNFAKEYFAPTYDSEQSKVTIDNRNSLYWNASPKIKYKQTIITFYNNDFGKSYTLIIEGLDKNGIPIYLHKEIN